MCSSDLIKNRADFAEDRAWIHQGIQHHTVFNHLDHSFFEDIEIAVRVILADDVHSHAVVFGSWHNVETNKNERAGQVCRELNYIDDGAVRQETSVYAKALHQLYLDSGPIRADERM